MPRQDKCHWHGGKSLRGAENPKFKTGQHSKAYAEVFDGWLREGYLWTDDADLVSLQEDIRVWEARRHELAHRIAENPEEGAGRWKAAKAAMMAFEKASRSGDADAMAAHLSELKTLIIDANQYEGAWRDMQACSLTLQRLKKEERKRREASERSLSMDQVQHFAAILTALALTAITDRVKINEFVESVGKLSRGETVDVDHELLPRQPFTVVK